MHNFTVRIHLLIFQTSTTRRFSCLLLNYYLSTYCGVSFIVLAYLCKRYFWSLIIIFIGCNPDFEQKWVFHTSPIAFGPYSKPKVESQSWLLKYHMGNPKTPAPTFCNFLEVWSLDPLACNAWGLNLMFKTCGN